MCEFCGAEKKPLFNDRVDFNNPAVEIIAVIDRPVIDNMIMLDIGVSGRNGEPLGARIFKAINFCPICGRDLREEVNYV